MSTSETIRNAYLSGIQNFKPDYFVTITFRKPMTDLVTIFDYHRRFKRYLNRSLFGRRESSIRYIFISEKNALGYKSLPTYHSHMMISKSSYVDTAKKLFALNSEILTAATKLRLVKITQKHGFISPYILKCDNNDEAIIGYTTKFLNYDAEIDVQNSDLKFI